MRTPVRPRQDLLMHLLAVRAGIIAIRHDGEAMTVPQSHHMLRVAADRIAAALRREALGLDASEVKDRFGFAA